MAPPGAGRQYPDFESAKNRFRLAPPQPVADGGMLDYLAVRSLREVEGTEATRTQGYILMMLCDTQLAAGDVEGALATLDRSRLAR